MLTCKRVFGKGATVFSLLIVFQSSSGYDHGALMVKLLVLRYEDGEHGLIVGAKLFVTNK